ncbi:MAG TPA: D-alanyl-D-alanine carboxypeptidase family protein [Solirubrobacterales bacterium]|nr:D-alanyl-D-alanine carboxypeptidase family protein [Solirubrobacterales bacterium]
MPRPARRVLAAALAVAVIGHAAVATRAFGAGERPPPPISAKAWYLIDVRDGARLAGRNVGVQEAIASTTKLMTAYIALHQLPLGKRLVAPPYHPLPGESLLGLEAGERISVHDLLYGLLLPSGNDAAVTLATGAAGSVPAFVREMNGAAGRLGLRDTSYANPIGLDETGNYSTARDLATLAMRLRRQSLFRRIVDTPRKTLHTGAHPRTIVNHNDLLLRVPWINGVKTGYTLDAGYVLVASGTRKGVTLLSVVMGAPSEAARDQDTMSLMRYGFSRYLRRTPVQSGETLASPPVRGRDERLPLVAAHSVRVSARRGQSIRVTVDAPDEVEGPIPRGRRLGTGVVTLDDQEVARVPLVSERRALAPADSTLISRIDDEVPGSRALAWAVTGAVTATIVIGIAVGLPRRRGRGQPGQGRPQ